MEDKGRTVLILSGFTIACHVLFTGKHKTNSCKTDSFELQQILQMIWIHVYAPLFFFCKKKEKDNQSFQSPSDRNLTQGEEECSF